MSLHGTPGKKLQVDFVPPWTPKRAAKERYPCRHHALLAPDLSEQLIIFARSSYQQGKKHQSSSLCSVQCYQEVLVGHQRPCSHTWVLCYCGAAAGTWEAFHVAAGGKHIPHVPALWLCFSCSNSPSIHLLPSILGCNFRRTALQLPSWASCPSKEDKRGWKFLQYLLTGYLPGGIELSVLSLIVRSTSYSVYILDNAFMAF